MTEPTREPRHVVPFAAVLQDLDRGRIHTEVTHALDSLVQAVHDTARPGTVTLVVKVGPSSKTNVDPLAFTATVKTTLPKPEARPTLRYIGRDGALTADDPTQPVISGLTVAAPVRARVVGGEDQ